MPTEKMSQDRITAFVISSQGQPSLSKGLSMWTCRKSLEFVLVVLSCCGTAGALVHADDKPLQLRPTFRPDPKLRPTAPLPEQLEKLGLSVDPPSEKFQVTTERVRGPSQDVYAKVAPAVVLV